MPLLSTSIWSDFKQLSRELVGTRPPIINAAGNENSRLLYVLLLHHVRAAMADGLGDSAAATQAAAAVASGFSSVAAFDVNHNPGPPDPHLAAFLTAHPTDPLARPLYPTDAFDADMQHVADLLAAGRGGEMRDPGPVDHAEGIVLPMAVALL